MAQDSAIVRCTDCGARNRVPKSRLKEKPLCGKCRKILQPETIIIQCARCGTKNRVFKALVDNQPKCGKCHGPLEAVPYYNRPVAVTDQSFDLEILQSPGPLLLFFYSNSCGYCSLVEPILNQLAVEYAGRLKIGKLNIEHDPMTASRFDVMSTPTIIFFQNGKAVDKLLGAVPKEEIEAHLRRILS